MRKFTPSLAAAAVGTAALFVGTVAPAQAAPAWNKTVKCEQRDADNRKIPTRQGNAELGWMHFSGKHNIKKCSVVNKALKNHPVGKDGSSFTYEGQVISSSGRVKVVVIVQYSRKTTDSRYDAGAGQKIGVITAYCEGTNKNKCPPWVND
ncbi:hypothetical protein ACH4SP_11890 [Streptomyces sp. NPDC021093]|uniref:hypothetical protein n=1 Tax=Streptomyces sp. NPDC021093 TaxID=3365112 RepID=UPI00379C2014